MEGHFDCALTPEEKVNTCSFSCTVCSADIQLLQSTSLELAGDRMHSCPQCMSSKQDAYPGLMTHPLFSYAPSIDTEIFIFNLTLKIIIFQTFLQLLQLSVVLSPPLSAHRICDLPHCAAGCHCPWHF